MQAVSAFSLLVIAVAGCGGPSTSSAASASSPARPIPTLSLPTGPPDNPTDQLKPVGWVVGTVTRGGSGPCYGLTTDEGTQYALHSTAGISLVKGVRVRVMVKPAVVRIYCGPGKLVEMTAAQPLR